MTDKCDKCGKPMIEGQAFYAGIRHWDCQYPHGYKSTADVFGAMDKATERAERALAELRSKLK